MKSVRYDVWIRGGVAATHELLADGHSRRELTAALQHGHIVRARQGHYVSSDLDPRELAAVRVGGRLTGLSGTRRHGLWSPARTPLHVAVPHKARALRSPIAAQTRLASIAQPGVRVYWASRREPGTRSLVGVIGCLIHVARTESARIAFASIESALYLGKITRSEWSQAANALPRSVRRRLAPAGRSSESGGESLTSFELHKAGIQFAQQVEIAGVGRVDIVIGQRLVIEIDGCEFHSSRAQFEKDRRRDALLRARKYFVLRFSYTQVAERWSEVFAAISAAIANGDHLA